MVTMVTTDYTIIVVMAVSSSSSIRLSVLLFSASPYPAAEETYITISLFFNILSVSLYHDFITGEHSQIETTNSSPCNCSMLYNLIKLTSLHSILGLNAKIPQFLKKRQT